MKIRIGLSALSCLVSAPAWAQAVEGAEPPKEPDRMFSIDLEVGPKLAFDNPTYQKTDTTAASLKLSAKPKLGPFALELSTGPSATLDADHDTEKGDESKWEAAGKISTPSRFGFAGFGRGNLAQKFADLFADSGAVERSLGFGLDYERKSERWKQVRISGSAARDFVNSTDNKDDRSATSLTGGFLAPLSHYIAFDAEYSFERRHYDNVDATAGIRERRDTHGVSLGFDISKWLMPHIDSRGDKWLRKLKLGLAWSKTDSNIEANDGKSFSPSFTIKVGKDFGPAADRWGH